MTPNVFISSTIQDLNHLRDSIRDLIIEIGYNPIMSEYGEIGYLPTHSAEESCYLAVKDCQLGVIIIGKRYGAVSKNGLSITHNEFRAIREKKLPVIFLVSEEVLSFKRVYDANTNNSDLLFPGMENPSNIFNFIREFSESEINNGLVQYSNVQSAKQNLKKQLAHIVGDLLKKYFDPVKGEIKDILSEITTLRHMLLKNEQDVARRFASAFRFLLNEENEYLKDITEIASGSLEAGVPELLINPNLKAYLASKHFQVKVFSTEEATNELGFHSGDNAFKKGIKKVYFSKLPFETIRTQASIGGKPEYDIKPDDPEDARVIFGLGQDKLWINNNAEVLLEAIYSRLLEKSL